MNINVTKLAMLATNKNQIITAEASANVKGGAMYYCCVRNAHFDDGQS